MTRFIRILTTITVMVHASLGCCAHEGHVLAGEACSHGDQAICHPGEAHQHGDDGHATCDHAPATSHANDSQSEPPTPDECDHAKCNWSAPELRESDQFQMQSLAASFEWSLLNTAAAQLVEETGLSALSDDLSSSALSLRSHLVKCVLLI